MKEIPLEDAEATLADLVDRAVAGEPTVITRQGRKETVLVSFKEWKRLSRMPDFAELLLAVPGEPGIFPNGCASPPVPWMKTASDRLVFRLATAICR